MFEQDNRGKLSVVLDLKVRPMTIIITDRNR